MAEENESANIDLFAAQEIICLRSKINAFRGYLRVPPEISDFWKSKTGRTYLTHETHGLTRLRD